MILSDAAYLAVQPLVGFARTVIHFDLHDKSKTHFIQRHAHLCHAYVDIYKRNEVTPRYISLSTK